MELSRVRNTNWAAPHLAGRWIPVAAGLPPGAPWPKGRRPGRGRRLRFTLPELLMVMVVLVILAALLMPIASRSIGYARNVVCVSNVRQLIVAWHNYQADHGGHFVNAMVESGGWAGPGQDLQAITDYALYPYVGSAKIYHCPADPWPQMRTYSINTYLNASECLDFYGYATATMGTQLKRPASTFVFSEEFDARGYNTNSFVVYSPKLDPPYPSGYSPSVWRWVDTPGTWHFRGTNLSFADAHVESWKWQDRRTLLLDGQPFEHEQIGNTDLTRLIKNIGNP